MILICLLWPGLVAKAPAETTATATTLEREAGDSGGLIDKKEDSCEVTSEIDSDGSCQQDIPGKFAPAGEGRRQLEVSS